MNENGQVFGMAYTNWTPNPTTGIPTQDPFLWQNGKMKDLGTLGGTQGVASWVNDRGDVVGSSNLSGDTNTHPFLWTKSDGIQDLGVLGGTFGSANWINDAREVVGITSTLNDQHVHAFFWRDGVMSDLGTVGTDPESEATSVNSQGQVVGGSFTFAAGGADLHGFLWEQGGPMLDLNTLVPLGSDVTVINAVDINDRGEIAAKGVLPNGDAHAVLLIPCDENHPGIEGCDYDPVEAVTEAPVRSAQTTQASAAAASLSKLSPAERMTRVRSMMSNRNRRFGALPPK
jgi:probable HAF family extracellular repeat protein